ncbi:MAG TPA: hypothetical protein VMY79_03145 [Dehalococcoidia bacterium]|nr:hypothetical protein [Dehalococcoidia bacterium]
MKVSGRQKRALEKITGKTWDSFHPEAVRMYFDLTDRGMWGNEKLKYFYGIGYLPDNLSQITGIPEEVLHDFAYLYFRHKAHGHLVKEWAIDFRNGLLSLFDFLNPEMDGREYPELFIEHAFGIYENAMGFIPSCYRGHPKTPLKYRLGI